MAARQTKDDSKQSLQKQSSRSDVLHHQKSIISEPDYSSDDDHDILKYWNKNKKKLEGNYGSYLLAKGNSKKRISRYYSINNNRTILIILQGDITRTVVDAIVNAANEHMTGGSGVDGMIHRAAGDMLYKACIAHKEVEDGVRLPTGRSRILLSYNMSKTTSYIINTAGPVYNRNRANECAKQLSSCYKTALDLANLYDLESIGFTAISCGIFGYPANDGADVALKTIDKNVGSLRVVVFVLWDDHIYDAWVKKAEELKLEPFDPESFVSKPSTRDVDNDDYDEDTKLESTSTYKKSIIDLSTTKTKEEKLPDETENLVAGLPSVPNESLDSQQTEILGPEDDSMDADQNLTTQNTIEMNNINSQEEENETKQVTNEESKEPTDQEKVNIDEKLHQNDPPSTVTDAQQSHE